MIKEIHKSIIAEKTERKNMLITLFNIIEKLHQIVSLN